MYYKIVKKSRKNGKITKKPLTLRLKRNILKPSNEREVNTMSQKKGNKKDKRDIATIALVTAVISLIDHIIDLISKLIK